MQSTSHHVRHIMSTPEVVAIISEDKDVYYCTCIIARVLLQNNNAKQTMANTSSSTVKRKKTSASIWLNNTKVSPISPMIRMAWKSYKVHLS